MSTDDYSSTSDEPPPENIQKVIEKLSDKHELREYVHLISTYRSDLVHGLRKRLLLQGLDEEDIHIVHEYLNVAYDGDTLKIMDKSLTQKRKENLESLLFN